MIGNKIFVKAKELKTRNAPRKRKTQLKIKGGTVTIKIARSPRRPLGVMNLFYTFRRTRIK